METSLRNLRSSNFNILYFLNRGKEWTFLGPSIKQTASLCRLKIFYKHMSYCDKYWCHIQYWIGREQSTKVFFPYGQGFFLGSWVHSYIELIDIEKTLKALIRILPHKFFLICVTIKGEISKRDICYVSSQNWPTLFNWLYHPTLTILIQIFASWKSRDHTK